MFITWKKEGYAGLELRGCIGCFSAIPLAEMRDYALKSALHDRRFEPVELDEVPALHCGVSLLTDFEEGSDAFDWELGVHGIIIHFDVGDQHFTATYLPEVAGEQGWDREQALRSLVRKAGYRGRFDERLVGAIRLTRYRTSKVSPGGAVPMRA